MRVCVLITFFVDTRNYFQEKIFTRNSISNPKKFHDLSFDAGLRLVCPILPMGALLWSHVPSIDFVGQNITYVRTENEPGMNGSNHEKYLFVGFRQGTSIMMKGYILRRWFRHHISITLFSCTANAMDYTTRYKYGSTSADRLEQCIQQIVSKCNGLNNSLR